MARKITAENFTAVNLELAPISGGKAAATARVLADRAADLDTQLAKAKRLPVRVCRWLMLGRAIPTMSPPAGLVHGGYLRPVGALPQLGLEI